MTYHDLVSHHLDRFKAKGMRQDIKADAVVALLQREFPTVRDLPRDLAFEVAFACCVLDREAQGIGSEAEALLTQA